MTFDLMNLSMIWCISFELATLKLGTNVQSETKRLELWIENTKNITILVYYVKVYLNSESGTPEYRSKTYIS